jgi:predicted nucleic acid-binding protein
MASQSNGSPLRIFFDSSVVIAGSFSMTGASYILLQLSNLTLIDGRISADVRMESERNVLSKLPAAAPALRVLLKEGLTEGASPTEATLKQAQPYADPKDVPILAAALVQECSHLVTLNTKHFWPPLALIAVARPGDLLKELRNRLYRD